MRKNLKFSISILILTVCSPLIMGIGACTNVFEETSDKTTDDALMFEAGIKANNREWTQAIALIEAMSPAGQAKRATKVTLSSYYAGRCGLDLLGLAVTIADGLASNKLFPILLSAMAGASASEFNDCKEAETILLSIDEDALNRTPDENVLLAFVEFAKIGTALASSDADADQDGGLDGGFDACSTGDIADASVQQLGTGITIAMSSLAASGSPAGTDALGSVQVMCDAVEAQLGITDFCTTTDPADFDAPKVLALRALLKSNEIGFNTCSGPVGQNSPGTANDCICPVWP